MCLILFGVDAHPDYRLVVMANRDEYYMRPTKPASYWDDEPHILGGRDLEAGGTWMGITKGGRFAALTNYRDLSMIRPDAQSRGLLVSSFLKDRKSSSRFLKEFESEDIQYNGFNLLLGTVGNLSYYSNVTRRHTKVSSGIHGLSNSLMDVSWYKTERGIALLSEVLFQKRPDIERMFDFLSDEQAAPDALLPDTGIGYEFEKVLSSVFIKSPGYGTRSSTVLLVSNTGEVHFFEKSYDPDMESYSSREYRFVIK